MNHRTAKDRRFVTARRPSDPRRSGHAFREWLSLAVCVLLAAGCASGHADSAAPAQRSLFGASAGYDAEARAPAESAAMDSGTFFADGDLDDYGVPAGESGQPVSKSAVAQSSRYRIYHGTLQLEVADGEAVAARVRDVAEALGGYVQRWTQERITVRIPAPSWEEAVEQISAFGRVIGRDFQVDDVTEEFVDLELQLGNLRALQDRLVELLARAENVEEALSVERELARVRGEIERIEGRLKLLSDRIAFATLTVVPRTIRARAAGRRGLPFPWLETLGVERLLEVGR